MEPGFDALLPADMAAKAEQVGVAKAGLPLRRLVPLGVLAGAFIGLGGNFSQVVTADTGISPGVRSLLGGVVFSLGLILVVISGAELFTGNTLIVIAFASRRVSLRSLLRNWVVVYVANFVGAVSVAALVEWSGKLDAGKGELATRVLAVANSKGGLSFGHALVSGILANVLVCLAVWMTMSAHSLLDKVVVIVPPITAFVAAGYEHSIANMYFFPVALFHGTTVNGAATSQPNVTWTHFLWNNLVPVTIGNVIGGAVLVGLVYWFVYRFTRRSQPPNVTATPPV
jgi:formate/nitrite transporter